MKKLIWCVVFLASCASGGHILSTGAFYDIPVGASQDEVVAGCGKPYAIYRKGDGTVEYEYIEKLTIGARNVNERHYIVVFKDGKVVSKKVKQESPLPYGFDSYDMQTTQQHP